MKLPNVVITSDMSPVQRAAVVEAGIAIELEAMSNTLGWQMLVDALDGKVAALIDEITSSSKELEYREEDRKRGQIAAYRDVIASVEKARGRQERLEKRAEAATAAKERQQHGSEADDGFGDFPGF